MQSAIGQLSQLPVSDRLELVQQLWDSIVESKDLLPVQEWHRELVKSRIAETEGREEEFGLTQEQVWDKVAEGRGQ